MTCSSTPARRTSRGRWWSRGPASALPARSGKPRVHPREARPRPVGPRPRRPPRRAASATRCRARARPASRSTSTTSTSPTTVLRLQTFEAPVTGVVSVWTDGAPEQVIDVVGSYADRVAGWEVEERVPLEPPATARRPADRRPRPGRASSGVPPDLAYDEWRAHWQGPHTQIAIDTQATFGYVQNRVVRRPHRGHPARRRDRRGALPERGDARHPRLLRQRRRPGESSTAG